MALNIRSGRPGQDGTVPAAGEVPVPTAVPETGVPEIATGPESAITGTPLSPESYLDTAISPSEAGHTSPVAQRDAEGNIIGYNEENVATNPDLSQRANDIRERDAARFAVTKELPGFGSKLVTGPNGLEVENQGSPEATRSFLERAAGVAGLSTVANAEALNDSNRETTLQLSDDYVSNFLTGADNLNTVLTTPGTILNTNQEALTKAWGLDTDAKAQALGPTLELTKQELMDDIKRYKFFDKVGTAVDASTKEGTQTKMSSLFGKVKAEAKGKSEEDLAKESAINITKGMQDIKNQPVLRGMIDKINQSVTSKLGGTGEAYTDKVQSDNNSQVAGGSFIRYLVDSGELSVGVTKDGMIMPFLSEIGRTGSQGSDVITALFNPEAKQDRKDNDGFTGNLTLAETIAPHKNKYTGPLQQVYTNKGGINIDAHNLSSITAQMLSHVGITGDNAIGLPFLVHMFSDIKKNINTGQTGPGQGSTQSELESTFGPGAQQSPLAVDPDADKNFSTSEYADKVLDVSKAGHTKYYNSARKRFEASGADAEVAHTEAIKAANKQVDDNMAQMAKHLQKHGPKLSEGTALYSTFNMSDFTRRLFITGAEINHQSHSGTLRVGTTFANITPTIGVSKELINNVADRAPKIFDRGGFSGENGGMHVIDKLHALSETDLQVLDTLLVIGATMADANPETEQAHHTWTHAQYVQYGRDNLAEAGARGKKIQDLRGAIPPKTEREGWLNKQIAKKKGEWSHGLTVYESARKLHEASVADTPKTLYLNHVWETDSTQSNAFIISTLVGDDNIMGLLGKFLRYEGIEKGDLRIQAANTLLNEKDGVKSDIDSVFTSDKDRDIKEPIKNFFRSIENTDGFAKAYGRGIVVAGLYGKTAWKMYKEANDFLSSTHVFSKAQKLLRDVYIPKYGNESAAWTKMEEDMSNLFAKSMSRHMSSLAGYQNVSQSNIEVMAAANGSSELESLIPNENIMMASRDTVGKYRENEMLDYALGRTDLAPEKQKTDLLEGDAEAGLGSSLGTLNHYKNVTTLSAKQEAQDFGEGDQSYFGGAARSAVSPNVIQSGDTYGIIVATILANRGREGKVPKNIRTIHDAIESTAGSTALTLVAYNDVFPYLVQKKGKNYLARQQQAAIEAAEAAVDNAGEYVIIGDANPQARAAMGFVDRHWHKLKGDFFSKEQLARQTPKERESMVKSKRKSTRIVEIAMGELGYLPPSEQNQTERETLRITKEQYRLLLNLMIEANGIMPAGVSSTFLGQGGRYPEHGAQWATRIINNISEEGQSNAKYGTVKKQAGKGYQLADKLSKVKGNIRNMPLI